jgi:hypothetical protein
MHQAETSLQRKPEAVKNFNVPGYYRDPKGHHREQIHLSHDAWAAYSCAIAYQLSTDKNRSRFADKTVQILTAWAATNTKTSNADGNLVMVYAGAGLVFAAELISDYEGWNKTQKDEFKEWLEKVYLRSCKRITGRANNWGNWGVLGSIASHYFLNDKRSIDNDIKLIKKKIDKQIEADGEMPKETKRGYNGIWYTYFALAPLTASCRIAANAEGVDLFHFKGKDGAGIEDALEYLYRYSLHPKEWPHYQKDDLTLPDPKYWPGNLFEAMAGIYGNKDYEKWIEKSRPIMMYGHHYAWPVPTLLRTEPIASDR